MKPNKCHLWGRVICCKWVSSYNNENHFLGKQTKEYCKIYVKDLQTLQCSCLFLTSNFTKQITNYRPIYNVVLCK
uniref:Uncharacterized protein n=1 Tax=Anguilla anguilla TaxID=7936 RepID=A0A0E9SAY7_ANGAN